MTKKLSPQTTLIHTDYTPPAGFGAFPPAIHHASTVFFHNVAALRSGDWKNKTAYTYGLHGTPTTFTLEARLAEIEGGRHCLLAPSGLAAITMVDPDTIVLGGGLTHAGDALLEPLRRAITARLTFQVAPRVALAELGDEAGCRGAALLAWRSLRPSEVD